MKEPQLKPNSDKRYDSTVDREKNPTIFVVY